MAEWPKQVHESKLREGRTPRPKEWIRVIPADLGRELWDLVDRALRGEDPATWNPEARAALVRYEQEVG